MIDPEIDAIRDDGHALRAYREHPEPTARNDSCAAQKRRPTRSPLFVAAGEQELTREPAAGNGTTTLDARSR